VTVNESKSAWLSVVAPDVRVKDTGLRNHDDVAVDAAPPPVSTENIDATAVGSGVGRAANARIAVEHGRRPHAVSDSP